MVSRGGLARTIACVAEALGVKILLDRLIGLFQENRIRVSTEADRKPGGFGKRRAKSMDIFRYGEECD